MPVAPDARYLAEALTSICAQSLAEWELVVVLDGACPGNERSIRRIVPASRLTVIEHAVPVGIAAALATGLRRCRADLVARMDADDICLPDRLRRQRDFLHDHPEVVALGSAAHVIDEEGRRSHVRYVATGVDLGRRLLLRNQLIHPSVMFRRHAVERIGGYNQRLSGGEDYELWLRLSTTGVLMNLADPLLEYRVWRHQFSRKAVVGPLIPDILAARRLAAANAGVPSAVALLGHLAWRLAQSRTAHRLLDRARTMRGKLRPPASHAPGGTAPDRATLPVDRTKV
jgi:glycosyltransferase involved in cell wall biosynthesis